jgi:hypothetical protein
VVTSYYDTACAIDGRTIATGARGTTRLAKDDGRWQGAGGRVGPFPGIRP